MTWTTADIPDQTGRVAVVTGGNGGLGLASVAALAAAGAHVVMAARNRSKAAAARAEVLAAHPGASVEIVELDLGDLTSVEHAADTILAAHDRVDVLMNNAGIMATPPGVTIDGFETQWGTNVLGHWALTSHLLPLLVATPGARVVWLSSVAQHLALGLRSDPTHRTSDDPWMRYGLTKLADRLLAEGLQRRFAAAGVDAMSLVAHPGLTNSDLQANTARQDGAGLQARFWDGAASAVGMSTASGARSQLRAATDPDADPSMQYCPLFSVTGPPVPKPMVRPGTIGDAERLFAISEAATGRSLDVEPAG